MTYDVLVAGSGPTGLMLACELSLAGARTAVLERLPQPTGLSKALGLQPRSVEILRYRSNWPRTESIYGREVKRFERNGKGRGRDRITPHAEPRA